MRSCRLLAEPDGSMTSLSSDRGSGQGAARLAAERIDASGASRLVLPLAVAAAIGWYALLLTRGGGILTPRAYGPVFNSMLLHLLNGRFDVDPAIIGYEGYLRDGATYAYFGIFPALFRILFLPIPGFAAIDFTGVSCLVAVSLMALFKALSVVTAWRHAGAAGHSAMLRIMLAAVLLSGAQIQFLRPSMFQEVMLWADVFAAAFVFILLRAWASRDGLTGRVLALLALMAGLCLLTRVSTALGLYLALGFIWLRLAWRAATETRQVRRAGLVRLLPAALILAAFLALTGFINEQRWGSPLVFVDLSRSMMSSAIFPDRLVRLREYGEFSFLRLGYGLLYYIFPVWVLHDSTGNLLWSGAAERLFDSMELPPGSLLTSDPLLLGLAVYGACRLAKDRAVPQRDAIALAAAGLAVPAALMLIAISLTFRYRLEFYPVLELLAFVGFALFARSPSAGRRTMLGVAAIAGILIAHAMLILYLLSPFGPAGALIGATPIVDFYAAIWR